MENKIEFRTTDSNLTNTWIMRITADRRIEVNEDVEVTEAAKKVLDAMQYLLTPQRTWVGLMEEEEEDILRDATSMNMAITKTEAKLKQKNGYAEEKNT